MKKEPKIALVHDFLTSLGGGERVLWALHELYPDAPIYTLQYDEKGTHGKFRDVDVHVAKIGESFMGRSRKLSLPFLPSATENFKLGEYDIVISSSSAFSKGVITKPSTLHICYCHTPMRYVWDWTHEYAKENGYDTGVKSVAGRLLTHYLRLWDQASAERVDQFVANSANVAKRIEKYYRKEAAVIYPPVNMGQAAEKKSPSDEPYFLIVSRLSPYKKIDLAIEACARLKLPLVVIGEGSDRDRLTDLANTLKAPVAFLGYQSDEVISQYYTHMRAFLFPGEDDFGITPVEAMSYGKPVIAYGKGGVLETIIPGKTGLLFPEPTADSLTSALEQFLKEEDTFKATDIKKQAEKFTDDQFKHKMRKFIDEQWDKFNKNS